MNPVVDDCVIGGIGGWKESLKICLELDNEMGGVIVGVDRGDWYPLDCWVFGEGQAGRRWLDLGRWRWRLSPMNVDDVLVDAF